jgi:hypothetical protein
VIPNGNLELSALVGWNPEIFINQQPDRQEREKKTKEMINGRCRFIIY